MAKEKNGRVKIKKPKKGYIPLGVMVTDKVSGFMGVAVSRSTWLYGVDRIGIQPQVKEDGTVPNEMTIDITQLKLTENMTTPIVEAPVEPPVLVPLGSKVIDDINGLDATVTGRCLALNGCIRIALETKHIPGKQKMEAWWTDEGAVTIVEESGTDYDNEERVTGGVGRAPISYSRM